MYNYKYFLDNFDFLKNRLSLRGLEEQYLERIKAKIEELKTINEKINSSQETKNNLEKSKSPESNRDLIRELKNKISDFKTKKDAVDYELQKLMSLVPNIPDESLTKDQKMVFSWGEIKKHDYKLLDHKELGEKNGYFSIDDATLLSGSGFVVYKDFGAELFRALQRFTLDMNYENGYQERWLPVVVLDESLFGSCQLPKFEEDLFRLEDGKYLSPTSESQLINLYRNKIIPSISLPIKLTANTNCFRREAGAAGTDSKGIIRMHQFNKTEIVVFCKPEDSFKYLEIMLKNACSILERLNLPYRVVQLDYTDISFSSTKTYDIEVWFPSEGRYREISSVSNTLDFQSRRTKIRYKDDVFDKNEKTKYLHILNGSSLAIDRLFAAVLENYQTSSGKIEVPGELRKYLRSV